jgi:hypothetical protein
MIEWPENPKEGEEFTYIDPIGGSTWVTFVYFMGTWQYLKTE